MTAGNPRFLWSLPRLDWFGVWDCHVPRIATGLVSLELVRHYQELIPWEGQKRQVIVESAELLGQPLLQDAERKNQSQTNHSRVNTFRSPLPHGEQAIVHTHCMHIRAVCMYGAILE